MKKKKLSFLGIMVLFFMLAGNITKADNGYRLWLKYDKIQSDQYLRICTQTIKSFYLGGSSPTVKAATAELSNGLNGLLGKELKFVHSVSPAGGLILAGTPQSVGFFNKELYRKKLSKLKEGGYIIETVRTQNGPCFMIISRDDIGVLYGVFHFLRLLQTNMSLSDINIVSAPKMQWRMLNHWDNLNGSVGRGYAGRSIWNWDQLPAIVDNRYKDYARANASIGINGVALNNVNASPQIIDSVYLKKVAALADVFRPYGIRVFLSVNFASPEKLGNLNTSDPLDPAVVKWWKIKADEIYQLIPDFGGFVVKADAEGQPGPYKYGRSHADGANVMADALAPHGGILIWRAFVYSTSDSGMDRAGMAYTAFKPLDGKFHPNVFLQIKNGPLDFQPREPFSPLFGRMPKTNEMMEFQITQEYLGHSKALVFLAPLFKETLQSDTYADGKGSTVARILDGSIQGQSLTGMAAVPNIGSDSNWTGYTFAQANWYAYGRLSWDYELTSAQIAEEWVKMTLSHRPAVVSTILKIMLNSREVLVDYQTPLGLHVLISWNDHYGPDPGARRYYHKADSAGLGFDRTSQGSNSVAQYFAPVSEKFNNIQSCPEEFLTWFHHVPWDYKMKSGRTFWQELCFKYNSGVRGVEDMQRQWGSLRHDVDPEMFKSTAELLATQRQEAIKWRDVCLTYFQKYSGLPIPATF